MAPLTRHKYTQILDIIEEEIIHTNSNTEVRQLVSQISDSYDVLEIEVYYVLESEYPSLIPDSFEKERELDADRLKDVARMDAISSQKK